MYYSELNIQLRIEVVRLVSNGLSSLNQFYIDFWLNSSLFKRPTEDLKIMFNNKQNK